MSLPEPLPPVPDNAPSTGSKWKHWKEGGIALVLGISQHTETGEWLVYYSKDQRFWSRPLSLWNDEARPGVKRFTEVQ